MEVLCGTLSLWFGYLVDLSTAIYSYLGLSSGTCTLYPWFFPILLVRPKQVLLAMMAKTATLVDREHDKGNKSTLKSRIRLESSSA